MALRPGQPIDLDKPVAPDTAALIYAWADNISRSVIIRNRSLAKVKVLKSSKVSTGINIFVHRQRPCLYATIAGIVVGVTAKDRRWDYMIDDGTQIIDVTVHAQSVPSSIALRDNRDASSSSYTLDMPEPDLRLADVVKVTGKIWRRQWGTSRAKVGLDAVEVELLNRDPTAESYHNLKAHELEHGEYAQPFGVQGWPTALHATERPSTSLLSPRKLDGIRYSSMMSEYAKLSVGPLCPTEKAMSEAPSDSVAGIRHPSASATFKRPRDAFTSYEESLQRSDSILESRTVTIRSQNRSLRAPSRLSDSECTQSLFRLHVQKFITDYCGDVVGSSSDQPPPAFSISFLQRVKSLAELADRIVSIMLQRRARKLASRVALKGGSTSTTLSPAHLSTEPKGDKIRRLFEWCIRELLKDGFIVIATEREVDIESKVGSDRRRKLARMMLPEEDQSTPDDQEAYQLVTSCLLREPIQRILRNTGTRTRSGDITPASLLWHLQKSDERWRFANVESVEEALAALREGEMA